MITGIFMEFLQIRKIFQLYKKISKEKEISKKHLRLFILLNHWLELKQEGRTILDYFYQNKIKCIAIYGMSYVGERLYEDLKNSDIKIKYIIDRNAKKIYSNLDLYLPNDTLPEVDAIIVTAISYFDEIKTVLDKNVGYPIVSLEEILNEL